MSNPKAQSFQLKEELLNVINEIQTLPILAPSDDELRKREMLLWRARTTIAKAERSSKVDGLFLSMIFNGFICDGESVKSCYNQLTRFNANDSDTELNYALALRYSGLLHASNEHLFNYYFNTHSIDALNCLSDGYANAGQYHKVIALDTEYKKLGVELDELQQNFAYDAERFITESGLSFDDLGEYSENLHKYIYSKFISQFKLTSYIQHDSGDDMLVYVIGLNELNITIDHLEALNEGFIDTVLDLELPPCFHSKVVTKFKTNF